MKILEKAMQRKHDGFVSIVEALTDLPGPMKSIRKAPPPAQRRFTRFDQVNQLVGAGNRTGPNRSNAHAL